MNLPYQVFLNSRFQKRRSILSNTRFFSVYLCSIHKKDIQIPVIVIVEEGTTTPHCFDQILFTCVEIVVLEPNSGSLGDISIVDGITQCGARRAKKRFQRECNDSQNYTARPDLRDLPQLKGQSEIVDL